MKYNFGITGAGGFVAPRHLRAIKETGHELVSAVDPSDSVGVLDQYFPNARFFTEFERFDRHAYKLALRGEEHGLHYVSVCSPNWLHDAHIRFALRNGAHAICEKPLVLNPWNLDPLSQMEEARDRKVYTILQLRLHPSAVSLRKKLSDKGGDHKVDVDLTYVTSRGNWYLVSWKGDPARSGGIGTNIGIHFYDLLLWLFGSVQENVVHVSEPTRAAGFLELERARVRWFLSVRGEDVPDAARAEGARTYRSLSFDGEEFDFSAGFEDLHTVSYRDIFEGKGFGIEDARPSIELAHAVREAEPVGRKGSYHPFVKD
ncbi:MAG: Gfo/Idh/MocA family oxidoreductase [Myxococcota bacterium]